MTGLLRVRRAPLWLLVGAIVLNALAYLAFASAMLETYPTATSLAFVLVALEAIPFLWFVWRLDLFEREPIGLMAVAWLWGAFVATGVAGQGNDALLSITAKLGSPELALRWGAAIAGPTTEEILKLAGVILIAALARDVFSGPLDGMVYGTLVGLGFQLVENVQYMLVAVDAQGGDDQVGPVAVIFFIRAIVGGLWSHAMYSAIAGAGVGYWVTSPPGGRRVLVAGGTFAAAYLLHWSWNSPLLYDRFGEGAGFLVAMLVKGLPGLVLFVVLYRLALRRERHWFDGVLAGEVAAGTITADELAALHTLGGRRAALRRLPHGQARRAGRRLQRAQLALAAELLRTGGTPTPAAADHRARIIAARADIARSR